jgi:hypothetical protein
MNPIDLEVLNKALDLCMIPNAVKLYSFEETLFDRMMMIKTFRT